MYITKEKFEGVNFYTLWRDKPHRDMDKQLCSGFKWYGATRDSLIAVLHEKDIAPLPPFKWYEILEVDFMPLGIIHNKDKQ